MAQMRFGVCIAWRNKKPNRIAIMFSERTGDLLMAASATIGAVIIIAALFLLLLAA